MKKHQCWADEAKASNIMLPKFFLLSLVQYHITLTHTHLCVNCAKSVVWRTHTHCTFLLRKTYFCVGKAAFLICARILYYFVFQLFPLLHSIFFINLRHQNALITGINRLSCVNHWKMLDDYTLFHNQMKHTCFYSVNI